MSSNFVVQRALMSVTDKSGLEILAKGLLDLGTQEILSTGGTGKYLEKHGIPFTEVADYTGFPEMMDGRVKTLHPRIHGGILSRRTPGDLEAMRVNNILPIDMVVVNLYKFEKTVKSGAPHDTIIENIDIGGPSLVRGAAKNSEHVIILTDPNDYRRVLALLQHHGDLSVFGREELAAKAFAMTNSYDQGIAKYFREYLAR